MDWTITIQSTEQQRPVKEKYIVLSMEDNGRPRGPMLFYDEIKLSVVKSSGSLDPKDSLLSFIFPKVIYKVERHTEQLVRNSQIVTILFGHIILSS